MNTLVPDGLPTGMTVPVGWSMPAQASDWQRLCLADKDWCAVFKAVFRLKTGINLDDLEHILFRSSTEKGYRVLHFLTNLFAITKLMLSYVLLVLLVAGLSVGSYLAFLNLKFKFMQIQKTGKIWSTSSSKNCRAASYYRLQSVKVDKVSD